MKNNRKILMEKERIIPIRYIFGVRILELIQVK